MTDSLTNVHKDIFFFSGIKLNKYKLLYETRYVFVDNIVFTLLI